MQATAVKQEAAELAGLANAAVISAAFKEASISCVNCEFPENCALFRTLLHQYTSVKIKLHKRDRGHYFKRWPTSGYSLESESSHARWLLRQYWPCQECIERFNPTGKIKYPNFNAPKGKDFLA